MTVWQDVKRREASMGDQMYLSMRRTDSAGRAQSWVVDYSDARAKAIEWLGDRYLLAKPVNRLSAASQFKRGNRRAAAIGLSAID
jgi:hypothetical protein